MFGIRFCQTFLKLINLKTKSSAFLFGCSIDAAQQQMALNFELVVSDQLFSVVLAAYK